LQKEKENPDFFLSFWNTLEHGTLKLKEEGAGATYVLYDANSFPCFIIKPVDEAILCLHNPKQFNSALKDTEHRIKKHIPLYRTAQTDVFCYQLATLCNIPDITPKALLSILSHPIFVGGEGKTLFCTRISYRDVFSAQMPRVYFLFESY